MNKVKGVKQRAEVITMPESMKIKEIQLDSAMYRSENKKVEILLVSTLNKNISLKPGTQVGIFYICKNPIKIVNENQSARKKISIQNDSDLREEFRSHLKS